MCKEADHSYLYTTVNRECGSQNLFFFSYHLSVHCPIHEDLCSFLHLIHSVSHKAAAPCMIMLIQGKSVSFTSDINVISYFDGCWCQISDTADLLVFSHQQ